MDSDEEDVVIISLLCEAAESQKRKKKWIHPICKKRRTVGEFSTLFRDLINDRTKFYQYFRMSYEKFLELLEILKPEIVKQNTTFRQAIKPDERLAVCLRFLATGDSFRSIAFSYRLGETTVREIVHDTCSIIWTKLHEKVMPIPTTNMWKEIERNFYERWNFPNCIGAIDGKHVTIEAPPNTGSMFFNYKKTFSVVLLALVDANYRFIVVDVGAYGKSSDGGIFASSALGKLLMNNSLNIPPDKKLPGTDKVLPHVIVGDEAFPLSRHIMRPYPGAQIQGDEAKRIFNYRLSRARRLSENAFGILVQKFRIYQRRLKMYPEHVDKVILASCCLHNFIRDEEQIKETEAPDLYNITNPNLSNLRKTGGNSTTEAVSIREEFKNFFVSVGSLRWQNEIVHRGRQCS